MSVDQMETLSTILIGYGAKRIAKDLVNIMSFECDSNKKSLNLFKNYKQINIQILYTF